MWPRVFINYRRDDSPGSAGRLYDRLAEEIPSEHLFMDVDAIAPGVDFVTAIEQAVRSCDILLVIIGRSWLTATDKAGRLRLDDPKDFVRLEIATALAHDVRVIPVLVDGATMPAATDLPADLQALVRRNAVELSHQRFAADTRGLARALVRSQAADKPEPPLDRRGKITAARPQAATDAAGGRAALSPRRVLGVAATVFAVIASTVIAGLYLAHDGSEWWFLRIGPIVQIWVVLSVMAGPALAVALWVPRLSIQQFWGVLGATFAALVAMFALTTGLQAALGSLVPAEPQTTVDTLLAMGLIEVPVSIVSGLVLGYFLAQALQGWFPDYGGRGFVRRMALIWLATGTLYAVACFLLQSVGEAAAARSGDEAALRGTGADAPMGGHRAVRPRLGNGLYFTLRPAARAAPAT